MKVQKRRSKTTYFLVPGAPLSHSRHRRGVIAVSSSFRLLHGCVNRTGCRGRWQK